MFNYLICEKKYEQYWSTAGWTKNRFQASRQPMSPRIGATIKLGSRTYRIMEMLADTLYVEKFGF